MDGQQFSDNADKSKEKDYLEVSCCIRGLSSYGLAAQLAWRPREPPPMKFERPGEL
jgi:hypothetical protein